MENEEAKRTSRESLVQIAIIAVGFVVTLLILAACYSAKPIQVLSVTGGTSVSSAISSSSSADYIAEVTAPAASAVDTATPTPAPYSSTATEVLVEASVNINTATAAELEALPNIGPVLAQRIIDYREQNGAFNSIEELKSVSGIGDKTYEKLLDYITVE